MPFAAEDLVEEVVPLGAGRRELCVLRPSDPEALIDEEAFEREERLPYWAELWPSGVALGRRVAARSLRGARVLELGCGLGVPSVAAALAGGRVLATDWSVEALDFTAVNAERNGVRVEVALCDWAHPPGDVVARGPFDLVLCADVLYERRNLPLLLDLLPRLVAAGRGEVLVADPGRPPAEAFLDEARSAFAVEVGRESPAVHRLRRR